MTRRLKSLAAAGLIVLLLASLAVSPAAARDAQKARWLKIRVYEKVAGTASVLVNRPMCLVSAVLRLAARSEPRAHLDLDAIIRELESMEQGQVVEVEDGDEKVSIGID